MYGKLNWPGFVRVEVLTSSAGRKLLHYLALHSYYLHFSFQKVIAVPDSLEEFLITAKKKLGLSAAVTVYTRTGGLIDDVNLIR